MVIIVELKQLVQLFLIRHLCTCWIGSLWEGHREGVRSEYRGCEGKKKEEEEEDICIELTKICF